MAKPQHSSNPNPPNGKAGIRSVNLQKILSAAEEVIAERGYGGATMAMIAERAGLPKANLHYYYGTKEQLYLALLEDILTVWLHDADYFHADADPRQAVRSYLQVKLEFSRRRPNASKVFATEVIHGGQYLEQHASNLTQKILKGMADKYHAIETWGRKGLIAPMDARQFFIMVWAITQTYADFEMQVRILMDRGVLAEGEWSHISAQVEGFVLRALGLD